MDLSVCDDEKDVVECLVLPRPDILSYVVKNMREISGATQADPWKVLSVDLKDSSGSEDFRVR